VLTVTQPYPTRVMDVPRLICSTCPVFAACHDHALHNEPEGIWAGTDPAGRKRTRDALGIRMDTPDIDVASGLAAPPEELEDGHRSARDIADALGVSSRTVVRHRTARRTA